MASLPNKIHKRSIAQRRSDFLYITGKLAEGVGWDDIYYQLNQHNDYRLTIDTYKQGFNLDKSRRLDGDDESELKDILWQYDIAIEEAYNAWLRSSTGKSFKEKTTTHKMVTGTLSTVEVKEVFEKEGNPKFLELYLEAVKAKKEFLKPSVSGGNNFNFNNFVQKYDVVPQQKEYVLPITSEDDIDSDIISEILSR